MLLQASFFGDDRCSLSDTSVSPNVNSFMFLFLENYGVRKLEALFAVLIGTMALSFAWMFGDTKPSGKELLAGENPVMLFSVLSSNIT